MQPSFYDKKHGKNAKPSARVIFLPFLFLSPNLQGDLKIIGPAVYDRGVENGHRAAETAAQNYPPLRQWLQYACQEYVELLKKNRFLISMSRRGNPYDNAFAESFMKTLKKEGAMAYGNIRASLMS
jgi:hypothetical protein